MNWAERYGLRMRAFLTPTADGSYTFYVSGDDNCELWLSTNDSAAAKVKIASVPGYSNSLQWTRYAEQKSAPIVLVAGQRYYIEALMKEGYGGDHLAVGWATTPTATTTVIPGANLTPFEVPATIPTGIVVEAGKAATQYAPNLTYQALVQALNVANANVTPSILWTKVSGKNAVVAAPTLAATTITLPSPGPSAEGVSAVSSDEALCRVAGTVSQGR